MDFIKRNKFYSKIAYNLKELLEKGISHTLAENIIRTDTMSSATAQIISLKDDIISLDRQLLEKSISVEKLNSEFNLLRKENSKLLMKFLHADSLLTARHLLERMENQIGRPNIPRLERWISFLNEREGTGFVNALKACYGPGMDGYSSTAIANQIKAIYSSLSSLVHNYDTRQLGDDEFVITVPSNFSQLQLCILREIITCPDALGFQNIEFRVILPKK